MSKQTAVTIVFLILGVLVTSVGVKALFFGGEPVSAVIVGAFGIALMLCIADLWMPRK